MESWNANLKRALQRTDRMVLKAEMRGMSTAFLEVRDYSAGSGDSFSVVRNGSVALTLTEGTDFDAETSNEQTAINIANAIDAEGSHAVSRFGSKLKIRGGGAGTLSMAVTSTDEDAWLQYRVGFPNRIVFCSDPMACNGKYGAELVGMSSSGSEFDIIERKYTLASYDIDLSAIPGSIARALVTSLPIRGQTVELYIGTVDLSESDYELFATMCVMDYGLGDSTVTLHLGEPQVYAADVEVAAHFVAMHPLDIVRWGWQRARLAEEFWDATSLDSTTDAEISHWLVSAHSHHYWSAPPVDKKPPAGFVDAKLRDVINEAARILPGMVRRDSAGALDYLPYDPEAAVVRHLERKDWESIDYETLTENRYTTVAAVASESELFGGEKQVLFRVSDPHAAALTGSDESEDGEPTVLNVESRFFGTPAWVRNGIDASDTTLEVWQGAISGISGCRSEDPEFTEQDVYTAADRPEGQRLVLHNSARRQATQRAEDVADSGSGRTAHYLITDGGNSEIVEVSETAYPDIGDPGTSPQYWYRPAAFVPEGKGGEAFVTFDNLGAAEVDLDTLEPFRDFPFATFEISPGIGVTRRITGFSPFLRMFLDAPIVATAGQRVVPRGALSVGGTYEIAYGILNHPIESAYFPGHALATITRGALGTVARVWSGRSEFGFNVGLPDPSRVAQIYDLTIAKRICEMQLERFRYGCPIARMIVKLEHGDIQEGDFISFDDPRFLWQEHDGATQTVIWEVIGKRVQPIGDSPRVELKVAWVRSAAIPYATLADPTWEIPIVSPVLPVPSVQLDEPYTDEDGAPYVDTDGGWLYPLE